MVALASFSLFLSLVLSLSLRRCVVSRRGSGPLTVNSSRNGPTCRTEQDQRRDCCQKLYYVPLSVAAGVKECAICDMMENMLKINGFWLFFENPELYHEGITSLKREEAQIQRQIL